MESRHDLSLVFAGGIMSRKGWLLFIAMSVIWGIPYLFIKIALQELDPSVVVFARVGIAAIVLLPLAARRGGLRQFRKKWYVVATLVLLATACYALSVLLVKRPTIAALPRLGVVAVMCTTSTIVVSPLALTHLPGKIPDTEVIASLLVLGVICTALAYMIYFALIAEVGASRATVITYVNPAVAVLLGVILLGEPLNAAIIVGFLLIIAGSWLSTSNVLASPLKYLFRTRRQQQQNSEIMVGSIEKQAVNPNTKEHA